MTINQKVLQVSWLIWWQLVSQSFISAVTHSGHQQQIKILEESQAKKDTDNQNASSTEEAPSFKQENNQSAVIEIPSRLWQGKNYTSLKIHLSKKVILDLALKWKEAAGGENEAINNSNATKK